MADSGIKRALAASSKAQAASDSAGRATTSKAHAMAARANLSAAKALSGQVAKRPGFSNLVAKHQNDAKFHQKAAAQLRGSAASGGGGSSGAS